MSIRALITSGDLSIQDSIQNDERLSQAFAEVWRRYQAEAGAAWLHQRTRLYSSINGKKPCSAGENVVRCTIGSLVRASGCRASFVREIDQALEIDWRHVRNTANLTLATSD